MTPGSERPIRASDPSRHEDGGPATLVWIDSEQAIIGHADGPEAIETLTSSVPAHHRSTGHLRHDPERHGGGGPAADLIEREREEHFRRFIETVAQRIPEGPVEIVGPGTCRERLARHLREQDVSRDVARPIQTKPSGLLTERQFVARLQQLAGRPAPRHSTARRG
jgi:hypothetical protein